MGPGFGFEVILGMAVTLIDWFHIERFLEVSFWFGVLDLVYCAYLLGFLRLPCFLATFACVLVIFWYFSEY